MGYLPADFALAPVDSVRAVAQVYAVSLLATAPLVVAGMAALALRRCPGRPDCHRAVHRVAATALIVYSRFVTLFAALRPTRLTRRILIATFDPMHTTGQAREEASIRMLRPLRMAVSFMLVVAASPQAQTDSGTVPYALGQKHRHRSARLGESREVIVTTPASYATGSGRYPVLYVLDGAENILTATAAVRSLAGAGRVPEMIVVGVVNGDRGRDFTPALRLTSEYPPDLERAGGGDAFLAYLGDELVPLIDSRYRTRPLRTIVGHSLGGLIAMYGLAVRPTLFRRYVVLDPSLWWDASSVIAQVRDSLRRRPTPGMRIVTVGTDSSELRAMLAGVTAEVFRTFVLMVGESHQSMMYRGVYDGLAALFTDYVPGMRHDESLASLEALEVQYATLRRDFGYDVPIPLSSLLEVANRHANQQRFAKARDALRRADSLYPGAAAIERFRQSIERAAAEVAGAGVKTTRTPRAFAPVTRALAAPYVGDWRTRTIVDPGIPTAGIARFELNGDTLLLRETAIGVALDGGDLKRVPVVVSVSRDTLRWQRENRGGGTLFYTATLTADGRMVATESVEHVRPLPAGFKPPRVTVEFTRRSPTR